MSKKCLSLLSLAVFGAVATMAQSPHNAMDRSYTGCIVSSGQGFTLATDGRQIALNGDVDFNKHVGHTVKVTGEQEGTNYVVSDLEHISATCDPDAGATASASDARAQAREAGDRNIAENDRPARPSTDPDDVAHVDPRGDIEPRADVDVNAPAALHDDDRVPQDRRRGVTADDQSNNKSDRKTTAAIRKSIVKDDSLSTYAHNVKIITRDGRVTLRGPVRSAAEKATVAAKAEKIVGAGAVDDQMTIDPDSDAHPPQRNQKEK